MLSVEVCASTLVDVALAMEGGADRVELCSVWQVGGITPNVVVVESAVSMGMEVRALIRPREGHFGWSASEQTWSVEEAKLMMDAGADRVVVGGLNAEHRLDKDYLHRMCDEVGAAALVWHRAIDVSNSPEEDVEALLSAGVTTLLTSGRCARAVEGLDQLRSWMSMGIEVVAGGGVRPHDVPALRAAGVEGVHASCRSTSLPWQHPLFDGRVHPVDLDKVVALVEAAQHMARPHE